MVEIVIFINDSAFSKLKVEWIAIYENIILAKYKEVHSILIDFHTVYIPVVYRCKFTIDWSLISEHYRFCLGI